MILLLLLLLAWNSPTVQVTPSHGFEPLKTKVRIKLGTPTQYPICIWFDADGVQWYSCFDGEADRLFYEKTYTLDAGSYHIWVSTRDGNSSKIPLTILERERP